MANPLNWILKRLSANVTGVSLTHINIPIDAGSIFLKEIGRLVNLRSLQLSIPYGVEKDVKQAYGIPAEISSLTKLEHLELARIGLSGPFLQPFHV